jgi:hypothetical protein
MKYLLLLLIMLFQFSACSKAREKSSSEIYIESENVTENYIPEDSIYTAQDDISNKIEKLIFFGPDVFELFLNSKAVI